MRLTSNISSGRRENGDLGHEVWCISEDWRVSWLQGELFDIINCFHFVHDETKNKRVAGVKIESNIIDMITRHCPPKAHTSAIPCSFYLLLKLLFCNASSLPATSSTSSTSSAFFISRPLFRKFSLPTSLLISSFISLTSSSFISFFTSFFFRFHSSSVLDS